MGQKAIIHTANRLIKRLSIDDAPDFGPGETAVDLGALEITFSGVHLVLNPDLSTRTATDQEIDDADVDAEKVAAKRRSRIQNLKTAIDAINADAAINNKFKIFVTALKALI